MRNMTMYKEKCISATPVLFLLILFIFLSGGCGFLKGMFGKEDTSVIEQAYREYREAFLSMDTDTLKKYIAEEKLHEFESDQIEEKLAIAQAFYPPEVIIQDISVNGSEAMITASGSLDQGNMEGKIRLIRENDAWKVLDEKWEIKIGEFTQEGDEDTDVARPGNFHEIKGIWKGNQAGESGEWVFRFEDGYNVFVTAPSGDSYRGKAAIRWDLGLTGDGSLRVPPGSSVLDIDIYESSVSDYEGKTSLGAYTFDGNILRLCFGEPGKEYRPETFDQMHKNMKCFQLSKSDATVREPEYSAMPAETTPPTHSGQEAGESNAAGEAVIIKDGIRETYMLKTGFFSETRFENSRRASLQFQIPAGEYSNARRIEMVLDATVSGDHYADGKSYSVFEEDKVEIGAPTYNGYRAIFKYIADGGQIFPPKESCIITVTSPYTGLPDGTFSGTVSNCIVHSAGIDYHIDSVQFTMQGIPSH
jgi:hypothetical protein